MVIDDYVPYDKELKKLIYAKKVTKNIWPILLEKAFAKFNGSYEDIVSGKAKEIKFFLPYPIKLYINTVDETKKGIQWNRIKQRISNHCLITWNTYSKDNEDLRYKELGLVKNHAYFITSYYQFDNEDDMKIRVLKVANPHSTQKWKGKWSDTDDIWNEHYKEIFDFSSKLPGEFYISFHDYLRYFKSTSIWTPVPGFEKMSNRYSHLKDSYLLLKVKIKTKSILIVSVSQYNPRLFPKTLNYTPSFMRVILAKKKQTGELKHIAGTFEMNYERCYVVTNEELEAGSYYIYVEMDQLTGEDKFSVLIMADELTNMQEADHNRWPNFIENWIKDYARSHPELYKAIKEDPNYNYFKTLSDDIGGYYFHYFQNYSKIGTIVYERLKYTNFEGLRFVTKFDQTEDNIFVINPGYEQFVIMKTVYKRITAKCLRDREVIYNTKYLINKVIDEGK